MSDLRLNPNDWTDAEHWANYRRKFERVARLMAGLDHAASRPVESVPGLDLAAMEVKP